MNFVGFGIFVLLASLLIGILSQSDFCSKVREEEKCVKNLIEKYFKTSNPNNFKDFRDKFWGGVLAIPEKSILSEVIKIVSRPINLLPPSSSLYMDMVEFRIKNLKPFRIQDCIIRVLLICGILFTMIFFSLQSDASDELYETAKNGFVISAVGILSAVILIFSRYMWVEKAINDFSGLCEELIVTGLIPSFHEPTNSVLTNAINQFAQGITDMQNSFSDLRDALQTIKSTQTANNKQMGKHSQQLTYVADKLSDLSGAISSVTDRNGPFVSLLTQVKDSETAFTDAIGKLLPHHSAELSAIKKAVAAVAASVTISQDRQSELHEASLAEIQKLLQECEQGNQKLLEEFASRLTPISGNLSDSLQKLSDVVGQVVSVYVSGNEAQREYLAKLISERLSTIDDKLQDMATGESIDALQSKVEALPTKGEVETSLDNKLEHVSALVSGQSDTLNQLLQNMATGESIGDLQSKVEALPTKEEVETSLDNKLEHVSALVSGQGDTLNQLLQNMATGESIDALQSKVEALPTKEEVETSLDDKLEHVSALVSGQGDTLKQLQASAEKMSDLADKAPQLVLAGKQMSQAVKAFSRFDDKLNKIAINAETAANKKGISW